MDLPDPVELNKTVKIKTLGFELKPKQQIARSLGPRLLGLAPPMADAMDQSTLLDGARYRFCRGHNVPSTQVQREMREFTLRFCKRYLEPLESLTIDYERYLDENTHYGQKRKDELLRIHDNMTGIYETKPTYKSFGKVENLRDGTKYKHVRCINPPPDEWKVFAAPYIHAVESVVCKLPFFAKYVPVMKRPEHIAKLFDGTSPPYVVTDYTSFESSMVPEVYMNTEGVVYEYMLQNNPEVVAYINQWNSGIHNCKFKDFTISIKGVRMSGDPNTSLGNGIINLLLMAYLCEKQDLEFRGMVEGDDGLFNFSGDIDLSPLYEFGFQVKAENHETIYDTSFCGLMLSQSLAAFANPRVVLNSFGWSSSKYRNSGKSIRLGLLRSKALSLMYCNPRCPILTKLAERYIELTAGYREVVSDNFWDQRILSEKIKYSDELCIEHDKGITMQDRLDFEHLYNISPAQQIRIEQKISVQGLGPIDDPDIDALFDERFWVYRDMDSRFCGRLQDIEV